MDRTCPGCGAPIQAKNVKDSPDGSVTFECVSCGLGLQDNRERTALRLSAPAAKAAKKKR